MGRSKRKNASPLEKQAEKSRRTEQDEAPSDADDDCRSQSAWNGDLLADLKAFIRSENTRNNKTLFEDLQKHNEERMSALENSLSFALTTSETLAKRLTEVEKRAQQTESDIYMCVKRMSELEQELDQVHQKELRDWLVFNGPAIPRLSRSNKNEDASHLLRAMLQQLMEFSVDLTQLLEIHREERQITVRFSATGVGSDRYILLRNRTRLRGSGLYIREKLTPNRQQIFSNLLQMKRENKVSTVFTRDGTVFVVVDRRDRPRPVRSDAALGRLARELAEMSATRRPAQPDLSRSVRPGGMVGAAPHGRGSVPWEEPMPSPGDVTSGPRTDPDSPPRRPTDGDSPPCRAAAGPGDGSARSAGQERDRSSDPPAGCRDGAAGAAQARCADSPALEVQTAEERDGTVSGSGGPNGPRAAPGGGAGGGDGAARCGGAGDGSGGGGAGAGRGRRWAPVAERAPAWTPSRAARNTDGVRHRFGGDIRSYVRVHSKCD